MNLTVNLNDREEIAAAHALLSVIMDSTEGTARSFAQAKAAKLPDYVFTAPIFGGAAAPAPLAPAPSTAAVAPQPSAPVAAPVSSTVPPAPPAPAPMPAPVAVAPTAPAAPTTPAPGVELDSEGLPWDARIHASTKTKVASGAWKAKKGINDPALVKRVEAELRAMVAAQPVAPEAPAAGADWIAPQAPAMDAASVFGGAAAPAPFVPPAAPSVPAAPAAPSASVDPSTFEQLMTLVSPLVITGKLAPTALGQACAANGIASPAELPKSPQFVPLVWATLKASFPGAFA